MLCDDLWDYLASGGISTGILFVGVLPDRPDTAIGVLETGGEAPVRAFQPTVGTVLAERPRAQIVSRAADYETARNNIHSVWKLLENLGPRTINGLTYYRVEAVQSPFLLERDANDRDVLAFNVAVMKERTA